MSADEAFVRLNLILILSSLTAKSKHQGNLDLKEYMEKTFENEMNGQVELNVEKRRFTRLETAKYLGVSVVTVDRAMANRKISFFRIGRRVVFDKRHLDEYLERNEYKAKVRGRFDE